MLFVRYIETIIIAEAMHFLYEDKRVREKKNPKNDGLWKILEEKSSQSGMRTYVYVGTIYLDIFYS